MTVPQANLTIYQGSLFTVTIPGGDASWGIRMQLRSAPVDQNGVASVTLTSGGGGIAWNGTQWVATITPTQSNAVTLLSGVWDVYGDPDGAPDNATVILEFGDWSMRPLVTATSVVPQPPNLTPQLGDTLEWNGTQWAPSASAFTATGLRICTLELFGGGNGVAAQDQAALVAATAAISAGTYEALWLGAKDYFVQGVASFVGDIFGAGARSRLVTVSNQTVLGVGSQGLSWRDFTIVGNGTGSAQIGIQNGVLGSANTGFWDFRCTNVSVESAGGDGFLLASTTSVLYGPLMTSCIAYQCGGHGFNVDAAEYTQLVNCSGRGGTSGTSAGLRIAAGNVNWSGGDLTNNFRGVYFDVTTIVGYINYGHGVISGCSLNHNQENVEADYNSLPNTSWGYQFVGCKLFAGGIYLKRTYGVQFSGCTISPAGAYVQFQGSQNTRFDDCEWVSGANGAVYIFPNYVGETSTEFWTNNIDAISGLPFTGNANVGSNAQLVTTSVNNRSPAPYVSSVASGGNYTLVFPVPTDWCVRLRARVLLMVSGAHVTDTAGLEGVCGVANKNGTVGFGTALTSEANPVNSGAGIACTCEWADAGLKNGGTPPTAVWSISTTNAVLTVHNPGANSADVSVVVEVDYLSMPSLNGAA